MKVQTVGAVLAGAKLGTHNQSTPRAGEAYQPVPRVLGRAALQLTYHTRAISMGITKAESRTLIDAAHHAKGRLCRMRVGAPAALA